MKKNIDMQTEKLNNNNNNILNIFALYIKKHITFVENR